MIHKGSFFLATVAVLGFARYAHADSCKDYMSSRAEYTLSSSGEEGMAWDGYKTKGGYYKTLSRISNVDECFTKCADRSRCSSFTYSKSRRTCALSTQEGATSSAEVSSGTVEFCRSSGRIAGFVVRSQVQTLAGKGYTADEVAKHNSVDSAWVVYDGKVYDLTDFVNLHPGGRGDILRAAGTDATAAFDRENSHREAELLTLKTYYIGDFVGGGMDSQLPEAAVDDDGDDTDDDDDDTDDDDRFDDDTDDDDDDTDDDDDDRYDTDNDTDDDDDDRYDTDNDTDDDD
ncbi:hypothetical protein M9434_004929 [Picochlorum sp. BPE23]|nr:hypothetical protein M9434_004929 [Picochlorum sp. BPE23]